MRKIGNYQEKFIAFIISCIVALLFGFNSPLHPWVGGEAYTDSSVFKTVALMMEHGYMPYRDSFDHKGPILYIINLIGNSISQYRGIWVIEIIFLTVTFYMLYKISRLSCGVVSSTIVCFTSISLLFEYYEGGNLTEEYAMPFIAAGIYIFLDYFFNNFISKPRLICSGICCGIVLMLRPNMISVWIIFCASIFIIFLLKKSIKKLVSFIIFFLCGLAIVIVPLLIWLATKHDLYYFFNDYVVFNIQYSSAAGGRALLSTKWASFFKFFNATVYILSFFSVIFHIKIKKIVNISYLLYLFVTIILMVMSGKSYGHYGMILIPAVIYPISLVFSDIEKITEAHNRKAVFLLASLYVLSSLIAPKWISTAEGVITKYETKDENHYSDVTNNIVNIITDLTDENDKISVYGNWDVLYVLSDRTHATRYSYQFPIADVMPDIMDEYMRELQKEMPEIIVVQAGRYDSNIQSFLDNNNYEIRYSSNTEDLSNSAILFVKC